MTPEQSFNLIDGLTKAIAIMDEKSRSNEGDNSKMLWNEDFITVRRYIYLSLETIKRIETNIIFFIIFHF